MNEYKKILRFARPHQKYIYGSLFFNILYSVFQIASLGAILPVLGMLLVLLNRKTMRLLPCIQEKSQIFSLYKRICQLLCTDFSWTIWSAYSPCMALCYYSIHVFKKCLQIFRIFPSDQLPCRGYKGSSWCHV
jgi:hypothetical protein